MSAAAALARIAEREGWQSPEPTSMESWFVPALPDAREQLEAYLCESLHCALTHAEILIALRAWGQACDYYGRLRAQGMRAVPMSTASDALIEARNRLEAVLGRP